MTPKDFPANQTSEEVDSPRDRIFQAALKLFSSKGFAATGVRELAREAQVNVAMINYFYGSKQELLAAVLDSYFTRFRAIIEGVLRDRQPTNLKELNETYRVFVERVIEFYSANQDLVRVVLVEMPMDDSPSAEIKAAWWSQMLVNFRHYLEHMLIARPGGQEVLGIMGPALNSAMASHFMLKPVIEKVGLVKTDEGFEERYREVIAEFCLNGLNGVLRRFGNLKEETEKDIPIPGDTKTAPPK